MCRALRFEHYATPIPEGQRRNITSRVFNDFERCLYTAVKFDSYSELIFARILERDPTVQKWVRPQPGSLAIYLSDKSTYHPDFVVETDTTKYLCELKRQDLLNTPEVEEKTKAAHYWCEHANKHAATYGGKPWKYLLIPHDIIKENMTLQGFQDILY